ncbi:MAG TPA: response regulator [Gammaproteobacteria bacterium]|nr:response regulator [Gammaproteobacteria bacterium]
MQANIHTDPRPRLLFVDDEQRVLNSMRIMFRRQFDLFLASHGNEALDIVKAENIDVIVADHRMPQMTGVEVLTKVRKLSPRTVRILLTGYADLDAVEGSINEGEVFRFLTKPCAPQQLRDTVELAAKLARNAPAPGRDELEDPEVLEIILESDRVTEIEGSAGPHAQAAGSAAAQASREERSADHEHVSTTVIERPVALAAADSADSAPEEQPLPPAVPRLQTGLGVIVFSVDEEMLETVQQAVRGRLPVHHATNIVQVVKLLTEHRPGVLLTDVSSDKLAIQAMTARLKQHLPQLVTIAVSQHRDVLDMVWLINHGQIFRFLRKPLSPGRCAISLQAALQHHRMLLKNPDLCQRHQVDSAPADGLVDGLMAKIKSMKRLWAPT